MLARVQARLAALRHEMGGTRLMLLYLLHRLLHRASGGRVRIVPYAFYAQPVPSPALQAVKPDAATRVWRVEPGDAWLREHAPRPPEVIAKRWAEGAECHACTVKEAFAGTIWLSRGEHEEDEVGCRYRLPPASVWDFDVYVEPRLRMGRTMSRLWAAVDARLAAEGVRWSLSRISRFNAASLRSHERLGAQRVAQATFVCVGRLQLAWLPGAWLPKVGAHAGSLTIPLPP